MPITYSELVKNEICHLNLNNKESKFFLKSFFINNLITKNLNGQEVWILKTHFSFIARFVITITKKLYDLKSWKIHISELKNNNSRREYQIIFIGNFQQIISDLGLNEKTNFENNSSLAKAFLMGAFLSGGSINSPQKSNYHLEIQSFDKNYLKDIAALFLEFKISKKNNIYKRRNKYIIYIKKSETIADILKFIGLTESLFKFEDTRIERDFFNNMRRLNNFDVSNLQKISKSSSEIINMIKKIKLANKYQNLPENIKMYCEMRLKYKEISLNEIAIKMSEKLKKNVSKSNVWHLTNKIKELYKSIN
ncbi:DNA-binding protein WhiA [Mycoplasmoides pirum]|uniref:DNA-binding protein WhiA n=1 Tax=Mycoplasmoides pirum TaxID=2122 RepID=UPI000487AF6A|nr:DNA-binding protein WhiA [Mycoplasmoides pirum]